MCYLSSFNRHHNHSLYFIFWRYFNLNSFAWELLSYHEICVGQIHRRPTRPKIRVTSYTVPAPMITLPHLLKQHTCDPWISGYHTQARSQGGSGVVQGIVNTLFWLYCGFNFSESKITLNIQCTCTYKPVLLADRRLCDTLVSVCRLWRYVLLLNGVS